MNKEYLEKLAKQVEDFPNAKGEYLAELHKYECGFIPYDEYHSYLYKLLALTAILKPLRVCELGTAEGRSAVALAKYSETVDTYDVNDNKVHGFKMLANFNINKNILKTDRSLAEINYLQYDLIFLDISHNGTDEELFHNTLLAQGYKGLTVWDDIDNSGEHGKLKQLWDSISLPKKAVGWHPPTGFGLMYYA